MGKNIHQLPYMWLIRALKTSVAMKEKAGWSRHIGAGFIAEDVKSAMVATISGARRPDDLKIRLAYNDGHTQAVSISELNLRETDELLKWARDRSKCPIERGVEQTRQL